MSRPQLVQAMLTKEEAKLLECFREMDMRGRSETLVKAARVAQDHPMVARPATPSVPRCIRLAASFGKAVMA